MEGLYKRVRVLEGEFKRGAGGGGGGLGLERLEDSDAHEGRERRDLVGDEFLDSELEGEVLGKFEEGLAGGGDREGVVRDRGEHVVLGGAKPGELLGEDADRTVVQVYEDVFVGDVVRCGVGDSGGGRFGVGVYLQNINHLVVLHHLHSTRYLPLQTRR